MKTLPTRQEWIRRLVNDGTGYAAVDRLLATLPFETLEELEDLVTKGRLSSLDQLIQPQKIVQKWTGPDLASSRKKSLKFKDDNRFLITSWGAIARNVKFVAGSVPGTDFPLFFNMSNLDYFTAKMKLGNVHTPFSDSVTLSEWAGVGQDQHLMTKYMTVGWVQTLNVEIEVDETVDDFAELELTANCIQMRVAGMKLNMGGAD